MAHTWTCIGCGEVNELAVYDPANALKSECWECGTPRVVNFTMPAPRKTQDEEYAEVCAAAQKKAEAILPVAVNAMSTRNAHQMCEIITDTCKKHGIVFAKRFMTLLIADERFNHVTSIMSPAKLRGEF